MATPPWLKVLDVVSSLALGGSERSEKSGGPERSAGSGPADPGPLGRLETQLAGVVVAALKEAFDRDKSRMTLERDALESERQRAERALAAELRRQAADRALSQLKLIAMFAGIALLVSGVLAAWIGGMRDGLPAVLLTLGWTLAVAAL